MGEHFRYLPEFTIDYMATEHNTRCKRFYSRFLCAKSSVDNVLAQDLSSSDQGKHEFGSCFPPFSMIGAFLELAFQQKASFVVVVPKRPEPWWPLLQEKASDSILLAPVGAIDVLTYPKEVRLTRALKRLPFSLHAFYVQ